ncbi:protein jim lovell isoform X2 [Cherax quadricarinatus]|uniref:protein jim lovell isoform X2 n=1 Tax=Cherax quadricarinatus TaxID=27406 RepID=UPI00387E389A
MMEAEVLALKWNNHQSIFYHIICGLRTKGNYTDVTLACEGKFYPVHKLVLSTCSEYFSDIFDRTPCKNPVVVLKDIQCQDLEFLLDYMYIGEVNVRQSELSSLIKAAECLKIKGLAVPDEEPNHKVSDGGNSNSGSRHRSAEQHSGDCKSPPPKRRRAEDRRISASLTPEQSADVAHGEKSQSDQANDDASLPTPDCLEQQLPEPHQEKESVPGGVSGEAVLEEVEHPPLPHIKEEQDITYHDNYDAPLHSVQSSYDGDSYMQEKEEEGGPKVEAEDSSSVMGEDLGVTFSNMLQSTFPSADGVDHHSCLPPHVSLDPWDGGTTARSLPGHNLQTTAASHNPLSHHQQKFGAGGELHCPICGRASSRRDNLERHIRSHLGDKPFKCPYCTFRSQLKWNMKSHIERRHPHTCITSSQ